MKLDKKDQDKIDQMMAQEGVELEEYDQTEGTLVETKKDEETKDTKETEVKKDEKTDTEPVAEEPKPKRKRKKKAARKGGETKDVEAETPTEPVAETDTPAPDDSGDDTPEDNVPETKAKSRGGPKERQELREAAELRYQEEIERLQKEAELNRQLLNKYEQQDRQPAPSKPATNDVTEFANNSLKQYREGLSRAIQAGDESNYLDTQGRRVDRARAEQLLQNVTEHLETYSKHPVEQHVNQWDDPSLPVQSQYANQNSAEYSKRVNISHKFAAFEMNPGYVENLDPDIVNAITTLPDEEQDIVIAGLGYKFGLADNQDAATKQELLRLGDDWYASKSPWELVAKINKFKRDIQNELFAATEEEPDDPEPEIVHKPAGKPTKSSREGGIVHAYSGTLPGADETDQEYFDRQERDAIKEAKRRYGIS